MISRRSQLLLPAVLLLVLACSGATSAGGSQSGSSQNLITAADIEQQHFANAHEVISALRPHWIQSRSPSFGASGRLGVMVYLDNNRLGGPEFLRQVAAGQIESARYLSATEATARYGTNHADGAILIMSKGR